VLVDLCSTMVSVEAGSSSIAIVRYEDLVCNGGRIGGSGRSAMVFHVRGNGKRAKNGPDVDFSNIVKHNQHSLGKTR
jgi:hypothetical protein